MRIPEKMLATRISYKNWDYFSKGGGGRGLFDPKIDPNSHPIFSIKEVILGLLPCMQIMGYVKNKIGFGTTTQRNQHHPSRVNKLYNMYKIMTNK